MPINEQTDIKRLFRKGLFLLYIYIFILLFQSIGYAYSALIYAIIFWVIALFLVFYSLKSQKLQKSVGYLSYNECLASYRKYNTRNNLTIATIILAIFTVIFNIELTMNIALLCGMLAFIISKLCKQKTNNDQDILEDGSNSTYFIFCAWLMNKNAHRAFILTAILTIITFSLMALDIHEDIIEAIAYTLNMFAGISFICSVIDLL